MVLGKPSIVLHKTEPFKHQALGSLEIMRRNRVGIFFEWGTGKTKTFLDAVTTDPNKYLPCIVVCKKEGIDSWKGQIREHSWLRGVVCVGTQAKRKEQFLYGLKYKRIILINYDGLRVIQNELFLNMRKIKSVVLDECSQIKNDSKRTRLCLSMFAGVRLKYLMTGDVITEHPVEIWPQLTFLTDGKYLGKSYYWFKRTFFYKAGMRLEPRGGTREKLSKIVDKFAIQVRAKDCIDLPPIRRQLIYYEPTKEQMRAYWQIENYFRVTVADEIKQKLTHAFAQMTKMLEVCSGFVYVTDKEGKRSVHHYKSGKLRKLSELITDTYRDYPKIVVWCSFIEELSMVSEMLSEHGIKHVVYGGPASDDNARKKFSTDRKCRVFIGQIRSGGSFNELIVASVGIYFSTNFSGENYMNSERRIYRIGSERHDKILICFLVGKGMLDEIVIHMLLKKRRVSRSFLSLKKIIKKIREKEK